MSVRLETDEGIQETLGSPAGASVSADIAAVKSDTEDLDTKLGTPAGADVSTDIADVFAGVAAVKSDTEDLDTKLGTPAGADVSTDIAAVKSDTGDVKTSVGRVALCITQWGGIEDELDIDQAAIGSLDAATKLTPALPSGATVWKAYLILKFREAYCANDNYVSTGGTVQVQKSSGGSWTTGITLPAGVWDVVGGSPAAGDCLIGNADVSSQVASGSEVEFRIDSVRANADDLKVRDIQLGLQIYFTI